MGQKVNPTGMRLGIVKSHTSVWYADKQYSKYLLNDLRVRSSCVIDFLRHRSVASRSSARRKPRAFRFTPRVPAS
jgi:small subunit ribosomal protein S3